MDIKRSGAEPSRQGPAEYFTGTVRIDLIFDAPDPARVRSARVTFEPGARTAWHRHPLGQVLVIVSGNWPRPALGWTDRGDPARRCHLVSTG